MIESTGRFTRDRPVRESRTLENMRNQPHCDNGEGVASPRPYPLILRGNLTAQQRVAGCAKIKHGVKYPALQAGDIRVATPHKL